MMAEPDSDGSTIMSVDSVVPDSCDEMMITENLLTFNGSENTGNQFITNCALDEDSQQSEVFPIIATAAVQEMSLPVILPDQNEANAFSPSQQVQSPGNTLESTTHESEVIQITASPNLENKVQPGPSKSHNASEKIQGDPPSSDYENTMKAKKVLKTYNVNCKKNVIHNLKSLETIQQKLNKIQKKLQKVKTTKKKEKKSKKLQKIKEELCRIMSSNKEEKEVILEMKRDNCLDRQRLTNLATCQRALIPALKLHKQLTEDLQRKVTEISMDDGDEIMQSQSVLPVSQIALPPSILKKASQNCAISQTQNLVLGSQKKVKFSVNSPKKNESQTKLQFKAPLKKNENKSTTKTQTLSFNSQPKIVKHSITSQENLVHNFQQQQLLPAMSRPIVIPYSMHVPVPTQHLWTLPQGNQMPSYRQQHVASTSCQSIPTDTTTKTQTVIPKPTPSLPKADILVGLKNYKIKLLEEKDFFNTSSMLPAHFWEDPLETEKGFEAIFNML